MNVINPYLLATPSRVFKTPLKVTYPVVLSASLPENRQSKSSNSNIEFYWIPETACIKEVSSIVQLNVIIPMFFFKYDAKAKIEDDFPVPGGPSKR